MRKFTVNSNDADQRLDKFVTKATEGLPASLMYKYIRKKRIKVNGKRAEEKQKLNPGDVVEMYIPDEFFSGATSGEEYGRTAVKIDVIYEDGNVLLVNKRPGVLVHTGDGGDRVPSEEAERETLIFAVKSYLVKKGEYDPAAENSFAPAFCNRIDRNTGGIVIAAKNARALRAVNAAIKARKIGKLYLCAVHGIPERREATVRGWLVKDSASRTVKITERRPGNDPDAREIVTGYRVIAVNREKNVSLLRVELFTGRTHQIRAHLAYLGYPLVGDGKYGVNKEDRKAGFSHQALCSYKTVFREEEGPLDYLCGREFCVPLTDENVPFLRLFPGVGRKDL
ncbi:MAG: RluA family pseudouridine synthase [Clostridia bacterium]|nr:RluA family pseudouridine synthase [Clostridia bacterium]